MDDGPEFWAPKSPVDREDYCGFHEVYNKLEFGFRKSIDQCGLYSDRQDLVWKLRFQ